MKKNIKIWMLIYAIIFFVLSLLFMRDDIESHYKRAYIAWSLFVYLLATCGNVMYALGFFDKVIRSYWKIISPLVILQFIISGIVDMLFSENAGIPNIYQNVFLWVAGFILFFPTFRANLIIGYGKEKLPSDMPTIKRKRPALVWVISIFYLLSFVLTGLSFYVIFSGKLHLPEQQKLYLSKLTAVDYAVMAVSVILNLAGAVSLFLLRKIAFYIFAALLLISTLTTIWSALTKGWLQALNAAGLVGAIIGYAIAVMICIYAWNLKRGNILT